MGRQQNLRVVDPVLTNIAHGYTNADFVGGALFPMVPVPKEGGKIPKFGKEQFKVNATERALRAQSNRILPEDRTADDYNLTEHDLEYPIDYREEDEDIFPLQEHGTMVVQEGIGLRHEKMCADLVQNTANFPAGNKIALSGTDQFTDAASDPLGVVEDGKDAIRQKIVKMPNTMIIGPSTYKALRFHPKLLEAIKYTSLGKVTLEILRELFEIETILVGRAVYADADGVVQDIWLDNMILAYVPAANMRSRYEPSYGYTLQRGGFPEVDTYDENGGKVQLVRSTDRFQVKILGADAGYLIENTNA